MCECLFHFYFCFTLFLMDFTASSFVVSNFNCSNLKPINHTIWKKMCRRTFHGKKSHTQKNLTLGFYGVLGVVRLLNCPFNFWLKKSIRNKKTRRLIASNWLIKYKLNANFHVRLTTHRLNFSRFFSFSFLFGNIVVKYARAFSFFNNKKNKP